MKTLITGIRGFAGSHLLTYLQSTTPDDELHGVTLHGTTSEDTTARTIFHQVNLTSEDDVIALIQQVKPDYIYHLAAQAAVPASFADPWATLENNIKGQLNLIQGCIRAQIQPRMVVVTSSNIYGPVPEAELPVTEKTMLRPTNPYGVSKAAQDMLAYQYYLSHKLPIMRARAFNHIGPGQREDFVASAFAMQIARIEANIKDNCIDVGDLTEKRDFTDVRDIVRAYRLIMQSGTPGQVYNVCSGQAHSIQSLLDTLLSLSTTPINIQTDANRLRRDTIPILVGDYSHLYQTTGWKPEIPFKQSLSDILNDARRLVSERLS